MYMKRVDRSIVNKWLPVLQMRGNLRNDFLVSHICNFCEWYSRIDAEKASNELPSKIEEIFDKMENVERVEIIAKVFNPVTCIEEYKLSNGRYIAIADKNIKLSYELTIDELSDILGIEYVKHLSIEDYRDHQITKIV